MLMTHEFKTPLSVVLTALQAIEIIYGNKLEDKLRNYLNNIKLNSYRQFRLANNLLDIARINTEHFKIKKRNSDIVMLTQDIIKSADSYAKKKGIVPEFSTGSEQIEMAIDPEQYERILLNLLSNSIKFTPDDKSIYINISCVSGKVFITVKDEGVGIPDNKMDMIFERFGQVDNTMSRHAEGIGIGLSLVKSLVEKIGGEIKVDSEEGKGSKFTVAFPITKLSNEESDADKSFFRHDKLTEAAAIEFSDIYL